METCARCNKSAPTHFGYILCGCNPGSWNHVPFSWAHADQNEKDLAAWNGR